MVNPSRLRLVGVYPRASGGTMRIFATTKQGRGLSPRERGNQPLTTARASMVGSIPARAGEPYAMIRQPEEQTVYPRASGGTA